VKGKLLPVERKLVELENYPAATNFGDVFGHCAGTRKSARGERRRHGADRCQRKSGRQFLTGRSWKF